MVQLPLLWPGTVLVLGTGSASALESPLCLQTRHLQVPYICQFLSIKWHSSFFTKVLFLTWSTRYMVPGTVPGSDPYMTFFFAFDWHYYRGLWSYQVLLLPRYQYPWYGITTCPSRHHVCTKIMQADGGCQESKYSGVKCLTLYGMEYATTYLVAVVIKYHQVLYWSMVLIVRSLRL